MSQYRIEYDNDTGPNDESFEEWWSVVDEATGNTLCRCDTEEYAKQIRAAVEASARQLSVQPGTDLRATLETALSRIEDMLADDDGQAFKEARKFLESARQLSEQGAPQGVPETAPLSHCRPEGLKFDLPPLTLSGYQLREALEFLAPDGEPEQLEQEVCIALRDEGKDMDGEMRPRGLYCWLSDYPEEGSIVLDGNPLTASPTAPSTEASEPVGEREAFEAYSKKHHRFWSLHREENGDYSSMSVYGAWIGWQARANQGGAS